MTTEARLLALGPYGLAVAMEHSKREMVIAALKLYARLWRAAIESTPENPQYEPRPIRMRTSTGYRVIY